MTDIDLIATNNVVGTSYNLLRADPNQVSRYAEGIVRTKKVYLRRCEPIGAWENGRD